MRARGFQGEIYLLEEPRIQTSDWIHLAGFAIFAGAAIVIGR